MLCFLFMSFIEFLYLNPKFNSFDLKFVDNIFNFQQDLLPIFDFLKFSLTRLITLIFFLINFLEMKLHADHHLSSYKIN